MTTADLWDPTAIPAATVVVVRDAPAGVGLEVLMLRRDRDLSFAGGSWVFPGGRIDPTDGADSSGPGGVGAPDRELAARAAAVREAREEAGLELDAAELRRWTHWTPPPESPKRFSTAFFVAALPAGAAEVVVDDGEIRSHRWLAAADALRLRDEGQIVLHPPTFITLTQLLPHRDVAAVLAHADGIDAPEHFSTRITALDDELVALYHGDAGYESGDAAAAGVRHRLIMGTAWSYRRDGGEPLG